MFPTLNHICPNNQSPALEIRDKTITNKWTYERIYKSLNSYSLVEYNKIYPNTNFWKTLQEESLWQVDFDNLYFWNTLNKTHQGILVWNRSIRLHTLYKKQVHKERKETTCKDRWKKVITTSIYIYINISTRYAITKCSQDQCTRDNVSEIKGK